MAATSLEARVGAARDLLRPVVGWLSRHRRALLAACAILFFGGTVWSATSLEVTHIDGLPLALMALVTAPLTLLHGALALVLLGKAAQVPAHFGWATRTSAYGQLAELLPLPGGAIVRTGALVAAGGRAGEATLLVLASAFLWIALAAGAAGLYLAAAGAGVVGLPLAIGGGAGTVVFAGVLHMRAGFVNAALTVLHRSAGLVLSAARLQLAFAAIAVPVGLSTTLPFVLANVAGSAASVAPGGLGVSEALAALLAGPAQVAPAAAFLAVALDRIVSASFVAVVVGAMQLRGRRPSA